MDAEIAVLVQGALRGDKVAMSCILDALEQARKERDEWQAAMIDWTGRGATKVLLAERDQAQKDAKDARALAIKECSRIVRDEAKRLSDCGVSYAAEFMQERIEAMLEPTA